MINLNLPTEEAGTITLKAIKNLILDYSLGENDSIKLNTLNFDDIVLEYRNTYNEHLPVPFYFMKVLVCAIKGEKLGFNKVKMVKEDPQRYFEDYIPVSKKEIMFEDLSYNDKTIYRCGFCGNVVDSDGSLFDDKTRLYKINILQKFGTKVKEQQVYGKCCPNGLDK